MHSKCESRLHGFRFARDARHSPGLLAMCIALASCQSTARAGGGPENVLLLIDPSNPDSVYVGNYYRHARGIPERNVLYMNPRPSEYDPQGAYRFQLDALFGTLANAGILDHIDYIVIPPGGPFFIPTNDSDRVSLSAAYTHAHHPETILGGLNPNGYSSPDKGAVAFSHARSWRDGQATLSSQGRRYFIGFMLGYNGVQGNTLDETLAMIDRSVAADGSFPAGTFYYMKTDDIRSVLRDSLFGDAVGAAVELGGQARQLESVLPEGHSDCLGIMTGWASPPILSADIGIGPGAFCDHLTSFAATFDNFTQVKMSDWIRKGASGTMGTVQEPFGIPEKFPHPLMHVWYFQGLSLGEAAFRGLKGEAPETLAYGDPLTRPFAHLPTVALPNPPTEPITGTWMPAPVASTAHPSEGIAGVDLYVDGVLLNRTRCGTNLQVDTSGWPDGFHDVRVIAYEDSPVASQGGWRGSVVTDNFGRYASLTITPAANGDRGTEFSFHVSAGGASVSEIQLVSNARVMASTGLSTDTIRLLGGTLGAGPVRVRAEARFDDGSSAYSESRLLAIEPTGAPSPLSEARAPRAYSFTKHVPCSKPILLELPASSADGADLTYAIVETPDQGSIEGAGPTRLLRPAESAAGSDSLTFRVSDGVLDSAVATVSIRYGSADGVVSDCDANGVPDACESTDDCNQNYVPDSCDIADAVSPDCDGDGVPDECAIQSMTSPDCNANGVPDGCETDCNANGNPDDCDLLEGISRDFNANGVPDECDIASGRSADCDGNGVPDEADVIPAVRFAPAREFHAGGNTSSVTTGDFNGDRLVDLAVTTPNGSAAGSVSVLLNDGTGLFTPSMTMIGGVFPWYAKTARLDADGIDDLVVVNAFSNDLEVFLNDGIGSFTRTTTCALQSAPVHVAVDRFDGDGRPDLAVVNSSSNTVSVFLNDGSGRFEVPRHYFVGPGPTSVVAADLDGDAVVDLAVTNSLDPSVSMLGGVGDGTFAEAVTVAPDVGPAASALVALDLDGDGHRDLALCNPASTSNTICVLRNRGHEPGPWAGFASPVWYEVGHLPRALAAGDLDADGDEDLVVLNGASRDVSVLVNNGDGTFDAATTFPVPIDALSTNHPANLELADVNGDGVPDVSIANGTDASVRVMTSFAGGTDYNWNGVPDRCELPLVQADLDADADVDLFDFLTFADCFNGALRTPSPGCRSNAADLDRDGDVDGNDFLTFSLCFNHSNRAPGCL